MNLRAIANRATSGVSPNVLTSVRVCTGYTTVEGRRRVPEYAPAVDDVPMQIQALTASDVKHLDSLNITTAEHAAYSNMQLTAVDRATQTGGDLVAFTDPASGARNTWLVTAILENWAANGWGRVALTKQIDTTP